MGPIAIGGSHMRRMQNVGLITERTCRLNEQLYAVDQPDHFDMNLGAISAGLVAPRRWFSKGPLVEKPNLGTKSSIDSQCPIHRAR